MSIEVQIPTLGESVTEGVIVRWIKGDGESVKADEPLFELETDKASVEIPAPQGGVVRVLKPEGATVQVGEVVARIEDGDGAAGRAKSAPAPAAKSPPDGAPAAPAPAATIPPASVPAPAGEQSAPAAPLSPAVRRLVEEHALDPKQISATGKGGRLTKGDVLAHLEAPRAAEAAAPAALAPVLAKAGEPAGESEVERVPMTRLRQRIAERLVQAQRTAAILTTFNEVDMSAVLELRARYKSRFSEAHGVGLGFMSFFAKACIAALGDLRMVNAQIDGTDIVYHRHVHLGVAVATERGLVVPVLHHADRMSFAEIERGIERLAKLARDNKLAIDDLGGGTFTISNGGVYGSLLSTPILNPPQSAILGMHKIQKRPVVVDDQIAVRPMMYLALSYDHRLIDGSDAVTFLVRVKERIEEPERLLLEV